MREIILIIRGEDTDVENAYYMVDLKFSLSGRLDKASSASDNEFFINIYTHRVVLFLFFSIDIRRKCGTGTYLHKSV